jgi:hypothetical protein
MLAYCLFIINNFRSTTKAYRTFSRLIYWLIATNVNTASLRNLLSNVKLYSNYRMSVLQVSFQ